VTVRVLHRPARAVQPVRAQAPLRVEAPPTMSDGKGAGGLQSLLPLLGAGVSMSVMVFARGSSFAAIGAIVMVVSVGAAGALVLTQRGQAGRKRRAQRETYLDYLDGLRDELRAWEEEYRARAMEPDPAPDRLLDLVRDPARLWERRRTDPDFLHVRLGTGAVAAREVDVQSSASMSTPADPFMVAEAQGLVRRFSEVRDVPLRVPLDRVGDVSVIGGREPVLEAARTVLAQVVSLHSAEDVRVAVLCAPERLTDWAWVRWLPHVTAPGRIGPAGPQPLVASTPEALVELLAEDLAQRASLAAKTYRQEVGGADTARANGRLLVVDDCHGNVAQALLGDAGVPLAELGITVLHLVADRLQEPGEVSARLTCDDEGSVLVERVGAGAAAGVSGTRDIVSLDQADALARELAPLRLSADSYDDGYSTSPANFSELLGITDPEDLDVASWWRRRSDRDFLRVPIGVDSAGRPVLLDLKESSQLGMGPHGLCVGATGSGKSELLRTMVLALALTHPPEQLALVLVDYKGGATFAPFESLPHVAGLITNLIADDTLVERMYSSLEGEVTRRQQVLAAADKSVDITEYALRREERGAPASMPALPHLVVFIDEFGELLSAKPEFIELFLKIGRIGRSIGVHLLLSSQRIESGKLRGLDTYLSYRLGLRTLSEMESRTVLDTPDAFHLPAVPGFGYLKVDVTVYEQFKAAYVSGPLQHEADPAAPAAAPRVVAMAHYGSRSPAAGANAAQEPGATARSTGPTLASTVITALVRAGDRVAPIWFPPLPDAVTLGTVGGGWVVEHGRGVQLRSTAPTHGLSVPVGLLDDPARQEQRTWWVDLDDGGGNLAVLGGPGSGKSTALRTLALGLAASHTPEQVGIYGVDLLAPRCARWRSSRTSAASRAATTGSGCGAPWTRCMPSSPSGRCCSAGCGWTGRPTCGALGQTGGCRSCRAPTSCCWWTVTASSASSSSRWSARSTSSSSVVGGWVCTSSSPRAAGTRCGELNRWRSATGWSYGWPSRPSPASAPRWRRSCPAVGLAAPSPPGSRSASGRCRAWTRCRTPTWRAWDRLRSCCGVRGRDRCRHPCGCSLTCCPPLTWSPTWPPLASWPWAGSRTTSPWRRWTSTAGTSTCWLSATRPAGRRTCCAWR